MKFSFDTVEQYDALWGSVHDSILYWKKVRQDAQGKICMQIDGTHTHYTVEECDYKIDEYNKLLEMVIDTPYLTVTPSTYEAMNAEFERDGTMFRILPTTQQEIDDRIERDKNCFPKVIHHAPDTLRQDED